MQLNDPPLPSQEEDKWNFDNQDNLILPSSDFPLSSNAEEELLQTLSNGNNLSNEEEFSFLSEAADTGTGEHPQNSTSENVREYLCSCTGMTISDIYLMTLVLGYRHNLTWEAQVDILKMIQSLFRK